VDDGPEDGPGRRAQAADPVGVDRQVLEQDVDGFGAVAVRDEQLHPRDVAGADGELADLTDGGGHLVENLIVEVRPFAADFEADRRAFGREREPGRLDGLVGDLIVERVEDERSTSAHHHRLRAAHPARLVDRAVDVLAVGLDLAEERRVGLVDALGGDRQADRGAVFARRFGQLADHQLGGDRAIAADPERRRRLPARFGLALGERHPKAVVFADHRLLAAEAFGVERGLVEPLGGEGSEIIARADRREADPQDCRTEHRISLKRGCRSCLPSNGESIAYGGWQIAKRRMNPLRSAIPRFAMSEVAGLL